MKISILVEGYAELAMFLRKDTLTDYVDHLRNAASALDSHAIDLEMEEGFPIFQLAYFCREIAERMETISMYEQLDSIIQPESEVSHG